ncbi:MAG: multiheme c-type cytochrome [Pirellulales bacterium]
MTAIITRSWITLAGLVIAVAIAAGGCDSSAPYQPPTAAVNGGALPATAPVVDDAVQAPAGPGETAAAKPAGDHAENKAATDPALDRPEYFVGWPKPKLALVISGRQDGYLEPCGCAGLENQKGGLSRRHAFFKQLAEHGWPVAAVDVGDQVRRFGPQAEVQFTLVADALKTMGYGAVGLGKPDLRLSAGHVLSSIAGDDPQDAIFVSANVSLFGLTPKVRIIEAGGMKLGITSVLGKQFQEQVNNDEVEIRPAAEALREVLPQLETCDVRVLLSNGTLEETQALAKEFPQFTLVVTAEGGDEPPPQPATINGTKSRLIEVGHKGMYVVVVGFYDDPKEPLRFQRVALDARFPDTPEMKHLMVTYQDQLQQLGWDGLGIRAVPHPRSRPADPLAGKFVGSAKCQECHEAAWDVWSNSKHAHATQTLVDLDPPRQFDAECISCHATGWSPQEFFPYASGYEALDKTPHLVGNGCENCHGPGAAHIAAEEGGTDEKQRDALRAQLHLTWDAAKTDMCTKCHDLDNSPEFGGKVDHYWSEIAH